MAVRSSNNVWIPPNGINGGPAFAAIGGEDSAPVLALAGNSRFPGSLGGEIEADNASALKLSNTTIGTLFMGRYQLVKFTTAITRGQLVFWDTLANNGLADYEVTGTSTAATAFRAGVALFTDAAATGKFGFIQTDGLANMLYANAAVGTIGLEVLQATAINVGLLTVNTVNTIADATAITAVELRAIVGIAYETPTQNAVRRVLMNPMGFYRNVGRG